MIRQFYSPKTTEEALLLHRKKANSIYLGGGTEINRLDSSVDASSVISLQKLGLDAISHDEHGLHIGAMVTFTKALENESVPAWLKEALRFMGSETKRNMATIGGNIALSSDDSYLLCTLLASRCRITTASLEEDGTYGEENLPLREYEAFHDQYANCLILEINLPDRERFVASRRFARTVESHSAVVCAFGSEKGQLPQHVRMYAALKGSSIERFKESENLLEAGSATREDFHASLEKECNAVDDFTGSAAYKRYLAEEALWEMYQESLKEGV